MTKIEYEKLYKFHREVLNAVGLNEYSNESVSTGLCETSLRGVDSHGVRLLPHYVASALSGRKNPDPDFELEQTFPAICSMDADNAFGHAAGMKAIDHGMGIAENIGVCAIAVYNSSHPGAMASMTLRAARKGYMAFAFTHADALVKSHNGTRPYFGTNPICLAAPRKEEDPYCLDMASSIIPWNRVLIHRNSGEPLAQGVAADKDGQMTTDPDLAACLMPTGTYKGFGIASLVEVLCGIYTGMAFGRDIPAMYSTPMDKTRNLGQFYLVMRTDGVIDSASFINRMQRMTDEVRLEPAEDEAGVMLAGDKEILESKNRLENGIPLDDVTVSAFNSLSQQFNVPIQYIED